MVERMPLVKEEDEFLTPPPVVNDAAFKRMCEVLNLDEDEQRLTRIAVASYEVAKQNVGDGKH